MIPFGRNVLCTLLVPVFALNDYADELPEIIPVHFFFAHTAWSHVKDLHVDSSANL